MLNMLQNLYVKNLALIDETEVEFGEGLNILTGENRSRKVSACGFSPSCILAESTVLICSETGQRADLWN